MCDAERFAALFREHYQAINSFCLRRLDDDDADDATAEVFITTWDRLDDIDDGDVLAWLYGVARNKVAHRWRANGRRSAAMERLRTQHLDLDPPLDDPASQVVDVITLVEAAATLSPSDLDLLQLISWEGLGPEELAVVLGCSAGAATVRVHRMRGRLQRQLDRVQSGAASGN